MSQPDSPMPAPVAPSARRRGRRPADAQARTHAVQTALADLESARVPFSVADVADRAGISRATLYRDANLRALVGNRGDSPQARPVLHRDVEQFRKQTETLKTERRELKRKLREAEARVRDAEKLLELAEERARKKVKTEPTDEQWAMADKARAEGFAEGFAAGARTGGRVGTGGNAGVNRGGAGAGDLNALAARLPKPALANARRTLVRALHPDLYAGDPAAALIATELLKQLNALAGGAGK